MDEEIGRLSARHLDVLGLIADGLLNKEIAAALGISESTVKTAVEHILRALNVPNRTAAGAVWATAKARREANQPASPSSAAPAG